ncbi:MAG: GNAT family N-acetyltransferase [Planifilum fimeticola]|jgi:GNAT superfamily N-acetyltransferase
MLVREFTLKDTEAAAELMAHLGYPTSAGSMNRRMERICSDPMYRTWVAEYHGRVVGLVGARKVILYESDQIAIQVAALVTDPGYRGRGIGRALLRQAEKWAEQEGAAQIYLTSGNRPERRDAHRFYKQSGYEITGFRFSKRVGRK